MTQPTHYNISGTYKERRATAIERIRANLERRDYFITPANGPILGIVMKGYNQIKYDIKNTGLDYRRSDAVTAARIVWGVARAYGLEAKMSGPKLAAGGVDVIWLNKLYEKN